MNEIWDRIEAWLATNAPAVLAGLNGPATEQELVATEQALGVTLPDDVRATYRRHNGSATSEAALFDYWGFMPLASIQHISQILNDLRTGGDFDGIENDGDANIMSREWWNPKWVPFAENGSGDHYCVDLAPGPSGHFGQVVEWVHDAGDRPILARDLRTFLSDFAEALERGAYAYDPEYGGRLARRDEG